MKQPHRLTIHGFTLVELMVTISIMAIIASVALPSYQNMIENTELRTASQAFYGSLVLARSEAVKNNQPVVICKSSNGTSCAGSGNWESGWLIYIDADADSSLDSSEQILESSASLDGPTIRATDSNLHQVVYQADGTQRVAVNFNVCIDDNTDRGSQIAIGLTGRPSTQKGATACP